MELSIRESKVSASHVGQVALDLAPTEAETKKDEGGGQGLQADELGHEFIGTVEFVMKFEEAEVWGAESSALEGDAFIVPHLETRPSFGWVDVWRQRFGWGILTLRRVQFEASVIQSSPETTRIA